MQPERMNVGLIEDDPVMGGSIVQRLELEGCKVHWWQTGKDAIAASSKVFQGLDIVVCDIRLPDMNGEDIYRQLNAEGTATPFIFVTGYGEIDHAVRLIRMGAADYLTKPFQFEEFLFRICEHARNSPRLEVGTEALGISKEMKSVEQMAQRYSKNNLPVLITGETGVGKEVTAKHLHGLSNKSNAPFMAVNCAAIPADLLESEIFGHERGAFTGAENCHLGYAERAGTGTLFLDEIGDMPPALQAKVLRLVEEQQFHRIGGEKPVNFKARIIAASHRELSGPNQNVSFREDLFFRLAVLLLHIAPLRERVEDIPWLMNRILADSCERHEKTVRGFSSLTKEAALSHKWPGNVRELRNRIERAVALGGDAWIMPMDMFPDLGSEIANPSGFSTLSETRDAAECRQIARALAETSGQIQASAQLLGVSRTTLWEKMTRFGIAGKQRSDS